jgi:hypothetical protein
LLPIAITYVPGDAVNANVPFGAVVATTEYGEPDPCGAIATGSPPSGVFVSKSTTEPDAATGDDAAVGDADGDALGEADDDAVAVGLAVGDDEPVGALVGGVTPEVPPPPPVHADAAISAAVAASTYKNCFVMRPLPRKPNERGPSEEGPLVACDLRSRG